MAPLLTTNMFLKRTAISKPFQAFRTLVGLFPRVDSGVDSYGILLRESLVTDWTRVGPFPRMLMHDMSFDVFGIKASVVAVRASVRTI